jgi:hypothetical protein
MISFAKPTNLNGAELRQELQDNGIEIADSIWAIKDSADGFLWLDIAESDAQAAEAVIAAHNGTV